MKKLLTILALASIMFSCQKTIETSNRTLIIQKDNIFPSYVEKQRVSVPTRLTKPPIVTTIGYKCIFMDFDGYTGTNSAWQGGVSSTYAPSGLDTTQIRQVKDRVAFFYQDYNVLVTTDESIYKASLINNRMRVVITTTSAWYQGVSGIAYIGSFTWGDNTPCFVFPNTLGFNSNNIGDIVAHESGHTIGLYHQSQWDSNCVLLYNYRQSCIMGYPFNTATPLWTIGATPNGCNTIQDDKAILANKLQLR